MSFSLGVQTAIKAAYNRIQCLTKVYLIPEPYEILSLYNHILLCILLELYAKNNKKQNKIEQEYNM